MTLEKLSFGLLSDGQLIHMNATHEYEAWGPPFTTGDVIGCALNQDDGTCSYTKNGVSLGVAFKDMPKMKRYYPMIRLRYATVDANLGQKPFVCDTDMIP